MTDIRILLQQRILILDGAMGTMVQKHKFAEADYRGERFQDFPQDLKNNNEALMLVRPGVIEDIHVQYLEAGADITDIYAAKFPAPAPNAKVAIQVVPLSPQGFKGTPLLLTAVAQAGSAARPAQRDNTLLKAA